MIVVAAVAAACGHEARRAAPRPVPSPAWTELTWKCEDMAGRRAVGPAILFNGVTGRDYDDAWHTRAEARAIARRLGVRFTVDC